MPFFLAPTLITLIGAAIHIALDRHVERRTSRRVVELILIWWVVSAGVMSAVGGFAHVGPLSAKTAEDIGPAYIPSMFQWEVGWGDIAIGVILFMCIWKRGSFMTAAIIAWTISYWGDAIGHIMQMVAHDNWAPSNVWSTPSDIIGPLLAIILLIAYRRLSRGVVDGDGAETGDDHAELAET